MKVLQITANQIEAAIVQEALDLGLEAPKANALKENILVTLEQKNRQNCIDWQKVITDSGCTLSEMRLSKLTRIFPNKSVEVIAERLGTWLAEF